MKFLIYIILLLSFELISKEQFNKNKLMRMDTFLSQTIQIGSNVHIYGGNGVILTSKDSCKTWTQKSFHDTMQIYKIEPLNNYFIGLGSKNLVLFLDSNLNLIKTTQLDTKIPSITSFIVKDNFMYLQNDSAIFKFDLLENKLDTNFNAKFKYRINNICGVDNSIFIRASSNLLIKFNLLTNTFDTINVSQKTGRTNSIFNLQTFTNRIYFTNNTDVFSSNDLGETWIKQQGFSHNKLFINNNGLHLFSFSKSFFGEANIKYFYAKEKQEYFDSISTNKLSQVFNNFQIIGINSIFDSKYIFVGDEKLIITSENNLNNIEVNSYLGNNYAQNEDMRFNFVNSKYGFAFLDKRPIYSTTDGGVTWHQKYFSDSLRLKFRAFGINAFDISGNGFHIDTQIDFGDYKSFNNTQIFNDKDSNFYSRDILRFKGLSGLFSNVLKENDDVLFSVSTQKDNYNLNNHYFSNLIKTDYNLRNIDTNYLDSTMILKIGYFDKDKNHIFAFCREYKFPIEDSVYFWKFLKNDYLILESTDQGKSWNEYYRFKQTVDFNLTYFKNNFYVSYTDSLNKKFIIEVKDKKSNLFEVDSRISQFLYFVEIDSTLYNFSKSYTIKLNENNNWIVIDSTSRYYFTDPIVLGKTIFFREKSNTSGSFYVPHIFKYVADDDSVKTNIEESIEEVKEFMLFPPYPNPSIGKINMNLIANNKLVVNSSKVKIVDIMGIEQNIQDKVSIVRIDEFNYNIKFDCENLGTGIYFIVVKINNASEYMPFVISK